jgi:phosphomannomutase
MQVLQKIIILLFRDVITSSTLKITYTPVHGVGYDYAKMAFTSFGLHPFVPVLEQVNVLMFLNCL